MDHVCLRGECQNNFWSCVLYLTPSRCQPHPCSALHFTCTLCLGALPSPGTSRVTKSCVLWRENRFGNKSGKYGFLQKAFPTGTRDWLQENGQRAPGGRIPLQELKNQMLGNLGKQELAGRSGRWSWIKNLKPKPIPPSQTSQNSYFCLEKSKTTKKPKERRGRLSPLHCHDILFSSFAWKEKGCWEKRGEMCEEYGTATVSHKFVSRINKFPIKLPHKFVTAHQNNLKVNLNSGEKGRQQCKVWNVKGC